MGFFRNTINRLSSAAQPSDMTTSVFSRNFDYYKMDYFKSLNHNGRYDNFYPDANRIVTEAALHLPYYVVDDEVDKESPFALALEQPNSSFDGMIVYQQLYTELITKGYSDIFVWHKQGSGESTHFTKKLDQDLFSGFTLATGYDSALMSDMNSNDIVRIVYGVNQKNVFLGYSPTQAAEAWRRMQDEMALHTTAFAQNGGMPLGEFVVTAPSIEDFKKTKKGLEERITGARNNGKVLFSYKPAGSTQSQIEWVQFSSRQVQNYEPQLEFAEKKTTAAFGVPATVKGTGTDSNYATARVSEYVFMRYTMSPLIRSVVGQLEFFLSQRFTLRGKLMVDIQIPELADESLVKIQATTQQVALYDQKIAEGYDPQSIVTAFNLPESFLLLEKTSLNTSNATEKRVNEPEIDEKQPVKAENEQKIDEIPPEVEKEAENLTDAQRGEVEALIQKVVDIYASRVFEGRTDEDEVTFKKDMKGAFQTNFGRLYGLTKDEVADRLADALGSVDATQLDLSDDELQAVYDEYQARVDDFTKTFTETLENIPGETVDERITNSDWAKQRVVVNEAEHSRIVADLRCWTKAASEFPVRVYKTWHIKDENACEDCKALDGTTVDVTEGFINNPTDEIYRVDDGQLHPNCRCTVDKEIEVQKDEGD